MNLKILTASAAMIVAFFIDKNISLWINSLNGSFLDLSIEFITKYITSFTIFVIITLLMFRKKRQLMLAWASYFLSGIMSLILKATILRERPFEALNFLLTNGVSYNVPVWNSSFPSWHVASMFSFLPFLKKKAKIYWIIFAIVIAFSRMYVGMHYLSDVIGGALLGYIAGYGILKLRECLKR